MANKKTREVWAGPGVLSMGRRKIAIGKEIPKELESKARKSLCDKGMIVDEVVKPEDEPVDLAQAALDANAAADEAEKLAEDAKAKAGEMAQEVEEVKKATSTAKGLNTKAQKEAKKDGATDEVKQAAIGTAKTLDGAQTTLERLTADLPDVEALAENAVRLRMEADKAAHAVETAE